MLLTTSLDTKMKVFLVDKIFKNDKMSIKFDTNEDKLDNMIIINSNHVICQMNNKKSKLK